MKKLTWIIIAIGLPCWLSANPVSSKLEQVRVFIHGAEITRSASAQVSSGINEIVFTGLPVDVDPNSIQLRGEGQFTVLSVGHRINYLQSPELNRELALLNDSLDLVNARIEYLQAMLSVYGEEISLLQANRAPGGERGMGVADLKNLADFFRSRMREVKQLQLTTQSEIKELQERQRRLRQQIGRIGNRQNTNVSEIVVTTSATRAGRGEFRFSYITRSAGWNAQYDIRANDTSSPVELLMKASVHQNTGEDWNNIAMTLSTGTPLDSRVVPTLETWFLRFIPPVVVHARGTDMIRSVPELYIIDAELAPGTPMIADEEIAFTMPDLVAASETFTTREYEITTPFSVPSGSGSRMVEVQRNEVPARFTWYAVPRVGSDAFLIARLANWEEYIVMPGGAGVFFENSWVGRTWINPAQVRDTLDVSMGADRGVTVERRRMAEFSRKGVLGRRTTETIAWELVIRNGKNRLIEIEVKDQVPVSTDADIQVTLEERSGAHYEEATGMLTWKITLEPGETMRREFRYSVRYPSDKILRLE